MAGSISFDRAAAYYDATRGRTREGEAAETRVLVDALGYRGPVLEIGVGTGLIAIPVHRAGVRVVGLDLSAAMLEVLVAKAGGRPPFPLVRGDATALPFPGGAMAAAMFRWVLHLIPNWRDAVGELVRVVRPGGLVLANLGGAGGGLKAEIQERFAALAGVDRRPVGLNWDDLVSLDEELQGHGATVEELPAFRDRDPDPIGTFLRALEENRYSWTWPVPEDVRRQAAAEVRAWVEARHGPADEIEDSDYEVRWRAFHLP